MTQGKPLHIDEFRFIWDTRKQFASVVSRELSTKFSHLNGGFRGKDTVLELQAEMNEYKTFQEFWKAHLTPTEEQLDQTEPKVKIPDLRKKRIKRQGTSA